MRGNQAEERCDDVRGAVGGAAGGEKLGDRIEVVADGDQGRLDERHPCGSGRGRCWPAGVAEALAADGVFDLAALGEVVVDRLGGAAVADLPSAAA